MKEMNKDVPVEVAALWAFRENRRLREKLEILTAYAKALEAAVEEIGKERDSLRQTNDKILAQNAALRKTADRNANVVPIKPKNYRKALGHIKQGLNMLEAGKYADVVEELDEDMIQEEDEV